MVYLRHFKYTFLLFVLSLCLNNRLAAQGTSHYIGRDYHQLEWRDFVQKAEQHFPLRFYYQADSFPSFRMNVEGDSLPLDVVLRNNLAPFSIHVAMDKNGNVFLTRVKPVKTALPPDFFERQRATAGEEPDNTGTGTGNDYLPTKNTMGTRTIVVGSKKKGAYSNEVTMSGYLTNKGTGEKVIGASLYFQELKTGVVSDANGFYSMKLKKGTYTLVIKGMENDEEKYNLEVYSDEQVNFSLENKTFSLREVVINAEGSNQVKSTVMGYEQISSKTIKKLPAMMGEHDIVKTALLLPGVQSVAEGSSGYNVRGSPADQNIFYLNQVPVYNTTHLFGFFSAFTPNAISDLALYKSSFPAQFGGHLSSIFDLTARQGNTKKFAMQGGISPVTANVLAEGPLSKGKSSYMAGVRSTYSGWVLKLFQVPEIRNSKASFNDAMTNFSFGLNDKNKLDVLTYYSSDDIRLSSLIDYNYENAGASLKWNRLIRDKHNFKFSTIYSRYSYNERNKDNEAKAYRMNYALNHMEAKANLLLVPNIRHQVNVGANSVYYFLDQGSYLPLNEKSFVKPLDLRKEQGMESGIYINEEWKIASLLSLNGGFRYNFYTYLGPQTSYVYRKGAALDVKSIVDTVNYPGGAKIKSYANPDLRFAANYSLNEYMSVKASFNQVHQYIFMLTNTIALSPTDKWKLVDDHIRPMRGRQYSAGFFSNSRRNTYSFSSEIYYKEVHNLVEYKDGANVIVNPIPETDVLQGNLKAYGIEFMLKKTTGALNGWMNYTYSRSLVLVNGDKPEEKINLGRTYPANYDKPHAFNLVLNYKFSHRYSVSSSVVYASGRPITYPAAVYYQNGIPIIHYSARNEFRIPDYFRVDLSAHMEGNLKVKKFSHGSWSVSVYNLFGRDNVYSVYFKQEGAIIKGYRLSVFTKPILSLTYNFKLGSYEM